MNVAKGVFQNFPMMLLSFWTFVSLNKMVICWDYWCCWIWTFAQADYHHPAFNSNALHNLYSSLVICNPVGFQLLYTYLLYSPIRCTYQIVGQQCHRRRSKRTNWRLPSWEQSWWKGPSKTSLKNWLTSFEASRVFARRCWSLWKPELWSAPRKSSATIVFLRLGPSSPFCKNIHSIDQWWMSSAGCNFFDILQVLTCVNNYRLVDTSFLKDLIVEAMPLWEDWLSVNKPQKKKLLLLFSLCFNINPLCGLPSRNKQGISKEVMQRRVSWFDNIEPEGTLDDFLKLHGWFHLSPDKTKLLVLSFMNVFDFFNCFQLSQRIFWMYQKVSTLSTMHLRIFHVSGVSVPVPPELTGSAGNPTIRANGDYYSAQIGTGADWIVIRILLGSPLIAFFVVPFFSGSGMVWVQLAAILSGIAEKPFFRKELAPFDVSSPSTASARSPSTTSPVTPGAAESGVAPSVKGGAVQWKSEWVEDSVQVFRYLL